MCNWRCLPAGKIWPGISTGTSWGSTKRRNRPILRSAADAGLKRDDLKIHLGVEADFRPARKAHLALLVTGLSLLQEKLQTWGYTLKEDEPLEGYHRIYVDDPFGNRIELMELKPI